MDIFHEEVTARGKKSGLVLVQYIMSWVVFVLAVFGATGHLSSLAQAFTVRDIILAVVYAAVAGLTFFYRDTNNVEFEYSLTNGELDFARIHGSRRRKEVCSVDLRAVEAAGFVRHPSFIEHDKKPGVKRHNLYIHGDTPHYYLFFYDGGKQPQMVVYEPTRELEKLVRGYVPEGRYFVK